MSNLREMECCAVKELTDVSWSKDPKGALLDMCKQQRYYFWGSPPPAPTYTWPTHHRFIIFTQAGARAKYGLNLKKFIEDNKLGEVNIAGTGINPNTRRHIKVFCWKVDHVKGAAWLAKTLKEERNGKGSAKGKN